VIETGRDFPITRATAIPTVTAGQMQEVDRLAADEFGIDILQMMEHAGSHLAELVRAELGGGREGARPRYRICRAPFSEDETPSGPRSRTRGRPRVD
jgi:hypothetical protein